VPGCVSGWGKLSERFGKLRLGRCLEPAIHYAREGFPVPPIISGQFRFNPADHSSLAKVYQPNGRRIDYGDIFKNPDLARSYDAIAKEGPAAFYEGEIADRIVAKSKELSGYMSLKDLKDHRADWVEPVKSGYRGYDVWEIPPNGQGIAALSGG